MRAILVGKRADRWWRKPLFVAAFAVQSAMGLGAFVSNALFGWIAHAGSYNASFLGLAIAASAGGALYIKMPETRKEK